MKITDYCNQKGITEDKEKGLIFALSLESTPRLWFEELNNAVKENFKELEKEFLIEFFTDGRSEQELNQLWVNISYNKATDIKDFLRNVKVLHYAFGKELKPWLKRETNLKRLEDLLKDRFESDKKLTSWQNVETHKLSDKTNKEKSVKFDKKLDVATQLHVMKEKFAEMDMLSSLLQCKAKIDKGSSSDRNDRQKTTEKTHNRNEDETDSDSCFANCDKSGGSSKRQRYRSTKTQRETYDTRYDTRYESTDSSSDSDNDWDDARYYRQAHRRPFCPDCEIAGHTWQQCYYNPENNPEYYQDY